MIDLESRVKLLAAVLQLPLLVLHRRTPLHPQLGDHHDAPFDELALPPQDVLVLPLLPPEILHNYLLVVGAGVVGVGGDARGVVDVPLVFLDLLQLVPPQLGLLELDLSIEEFVEHLHAVDRVGWLFLPAFGLVSPAVRQKSRLFDLFDGSIQLLLRVHHQLLCVQVSQFEVDDQLPSLFDELRLDVAIYNVHHNLSIDLEYLGVVGGDRSSVLVRLVLDDLLDAAHFSLPQHAESLRFALLADVQGHLSVHYDHYLARNALFISQNSVSRVLPALRGQQDLLEQGPLDLAEHPDGLEEIDPVPELLVLEVPGEGVVEDVHGQLQEIARGGRPCALQLFLAVLHFLPEVLAGLESFEELGLLALLLVPGAREEEDCALEDVVEGALVLVLEDDLSEVDLEELDAGEYDLEVEVSLLLVDEVEERDLQQEVLLLCLLLGRQLRLVVEELLTHLLEILCFHYKGKRRGSGSIDKTINPAQLPIVTAPF